MTDPATSRPRRLTRPDSVVLHGEEIGTGPSVLLLHAGGEQRQVWTPVTTLLSAAGFRCVAYDQRGHGESGGERKTFAPCAADVGAMVLAEPPGCLVVGASLGGLATLAALADPAVRDRVARLVLVDVVPDIDPARARRFLADAGVLDGYTELVEDILAQLPRLRRLTATLDLPLRLVRAGTDTPLSDDDIARFRNTAPHATVTEIPQAGHLVARDQPAALAAAIATECRHLRLGRGRGGRTAARSRVGGP
ncbi:alpha/beta fold hydrolase [Nocardia otitidiscaviarum]|uniref:alpha/beta fold hydrolase n=1 Tax=Nocardia otitidiscaviarum TaxID=1823 RepID=UPI00245833D6|nr:alpha/beta fold hydrolase [Nocardia otitidiscaviarum]